MAHETLTWHKVERWIDKLIAAEVLALASAPPDHRLAWAQGRLQALQAVKRAPEAVALMEAEHADTGTARRAWEPWVVESSNGPGRATG